MNHQPAAYTPLESLFLFQSILTHGVGDGAFTRISELLINNGLIKDSDTYDPARLSPDALQRLFLLLLREEIHSGTERTDGGDGSVSPNTRKRKLGSPPLPTLKDVREHVEKIPVLVDRLYARYQDHIVKQIREDEARFAQVQKEILLLERTERERRAARAASQNGTPALAPREVKPATAPNRPSPTPTPTPVATPATVVKRTPTPQTPVLPPKPPTPHVAPPTVAPPSHLPLGTTPIRPTPSPKPTNGTGSVLQAPTGVPPGGPRPLQPPSQPPKQVISPRPEVGIKPKDGSVPLQTPTPAAAALKWEKPYQPPQATQTPPPRQFQSPIQQGPAPPPGQQHPQQHPQLQQQYQQQHQQVSQPLPQQHQQQQQQWYPQPTAQYPSQTPAQGQPGRPHPPQHPQHQQHPQPQPHSPNVQHSLPQQRPQPPQQPQQYPQHVQHPPHPHAQHAQHQRPPHVQHAQTRPPQGKPVLVPPQNAGQLAPPLQPAPPRPTGQTSNVKSPQVRPSSTTPVHPPTRPIQPPQSQAQQAPNAQHTQHPPRPIASASPTPPAGVTGPIAPPQQRWPQAHPQQQQQPKATAKPTASPVLQKDKGYASPYVAQPPRPAIPEHIIRQAVSTPGPSRRISTPTAPQTPVSSSQALLTKGFATRWSTQSTPSTPRPLSMEPESPAYEPMSPPQLPAALPGSGLKPAPKKQAAKPNVKTESNALKPVRSRGMRSSQKGRGVSATPSLTRSRRSQSVLSHTEEPPANQPELAPIIKNEAATPRPMEETGDTTANESGPDRPQIVTPSSVASRLHKRKRQDMPIELPPATTQVLWTRGFTKVSSSALDQISSHRDANMFATAIRQKDAPNYRQIVLQPQDITSIRSAIKHSNKAAVHAAQSLPGGDPGTAHVWLPLSEELVPPKGIINSAQLERELVHMFCNAIMYNPDPDRGPGPGFMKRSQDEEEEVVGYRLDENGIVKNTRSMFVEVEKLLGDLRSAEKERSAPPPSATRPASVATPADDTADDDDEAGDGETGTGTVKRRRIGTRG